MKHVLLFFFLFSFLGINAQDFYDVETIEEIRIYFAEDNWDEILDQYYIDGQEQRLLASVEINGELFDSVGIRYKGFSSVSTDRDKNPFNIKLDYIIDGQDYKGFDKIKLSNVIQDPSFLREVLSYEIARKYMPAPKANFANVFINNELWGLYTNVEAINGDFISDNFGSNNNPFFKCNPEELDFDGENANLNNSPGQDSTDYFSLYELRSEKGWSELLELIDVLNESPENIEEILQVDQTLWMHAFNYALVNFDSYIGYAQNYYLYQDDNGLFYPLIWDLNMSFGSFRFTDASEFFDGFSIEDAKTIDPLSHINSVSVYPRPLLRKLLENETYQRMYLAHMRTILEENFLNSDYLLRGETMRAVIDQSVQNDQNKFYSYQDFQDNLYTTVSDLIDYPGISDLMSNRTDYLMNLSGLSQAPTINAFDNSPQDLSLNGSMLFRLETENAENALFYYRYSESDWFTKVEMKDDGTSGDEIAGDGIFSYELLNTSNSIQYYFYAENEAAGRFAPERAAREFYSLFTPLEGNFLQINELMATNINTVADNEGEFDDWIELYNTSNNAISTAGMYLSDEPGNPTKWALPNVIVEADAYLNIWADENGGQGYDHANFRLSSLGEFLTLTYADGTILDSLIYPAQTENKSWGRIPNGTGPFEELFPTFGYNNEEMTGINNFNAVENVVIFPNPSTGSFKVQLSVNKWKGSIELYALDGKRLSLFQETISEGLYELQVQDRPASAGIYFLKIPFESGFQTFKVIIE